MQFFAFFDKKSGLFSRPQHFPHVAEALRATERAVNDGKSFLAEHPSDYDLYEVDSFDERNGSFSRPDSEDGIPYPRMVCSVASLLKVENGGVA